MLRPLLPVLIGTILLAGCAREPLVSTPNLQVVTDAALPSPTREDLAPPNRLAFIGPLDTLGIDVFDVPQLSKEVSVDAGGHVSMPLVGSIDANGLTAVELADKIADALRGRYVRNPQVTVNIKDSVSQLVTVDGSVDKPGQYPVTNQSTLLRTIALSGGLSEFAKEDDIVILRTVGSHRMAGLYNLGQIRRGAYIDPAIYPNDVVVVGDSPARRLFRNVLAVAPLLTAPLIAIIQ